jgi:hypothetical protein
MSNPYYSLLNPIPPRTIARATVLNNEFRAIEEGFARLPPADALRSRTSDFAVATGTANNYIAALNPAPQAYTVGLAFRMKIPALQTNTGPATVNLNGLGPRPILRVNGSPLQAGDLVGGATYLLSDDGVTGFRLIGGSGLAMSGDAVPPHTHAIADIIGLAELLGQPFITAESLGLPADGVTDDSDLLNASFLARSAAGGAVYFLESPSGFFRINKRVRIRSGCRVFFGGRTIIRRGKLGRLVLQGNLEEEPENDKPFLTADVALGATVLPLNTTAGLSAGTRIIIRGLMDGDLNAQERQETSIVSISGLNITIANPTEFAFKAVYPPGAYEANFGVPNRTRISAKVAAELTVNPSVGDFVLNCNPARLGSFEVGDTVLVTDSKKAKDIAGTSNNRIHVELATILAKNPTTGAVTLDHALQNPITMAFDARLEKIVPCQNAWLVGARVQTVEDADPAPAPRVHPIEIQRGRNCVVMDCELLDETTFGTRGNAFRVFESLYSHRVRCKAGRRKFTGSGDGYALAEYYSTGTVDFDCSATGARHTDLRQGSNLFISYGLTSVDSGQSDIDCHGLNERNGVWCGFQIIGGPTVAEGITTLAAIKLGNPTHVAGCFNISVRGGRITGYFGNNGRAIQLLPGANRCDVSDIEINGAEFGLFYRQNADFPAILSTGCRLTNITMFDITNRAVDLRADELQTGTRSLVDITLEGLKVRRARDVLKCHDIDGLAIIGFDSAEPRGGGTQNFSLELRRSARVVVAYSRFQGLNKGVTIQDCPAFVLAHNVIGPILSVPHVEELGGSNGSRLLNNSYVGAPSMVIASTLDAHFDLQLYPTAGQISDGLHLWATDSGTANDYVLTSVVPATAYTLGLTRRFKAQNANTGQSTVNVDGLGLKWIKTTAQAHLSAGQIPAGGIVQIVYDGTNFQLTGV